MKKYLSIFALLVASILTIAAAVIIDDGDVVKKYITIHLKNGTTIKQFVDSIDSIDFGDTIYHVPVIKSVEFSSKNLTIENGKTASLTYKVLEEGASQKCSVYVTDSTIANYRDGVVTAFSEGSTSIIATASDGIHADTCLVTVTPPKQILNGVQFNRSSMQLDPGTSEFRTLYLLPDESVSDQVETVTYDVSDRSVIEVAQQGTNGLSFKVTGLKSGKSTLTAIVNGKYSASIEYVVTQEVTGITLSESYFSLKKDSQKQLVATVTPEDATNKKVTWVSSDSTVAKVSSTGIVYGIAAGTATITAYAGSCSASCEFKITDDPIPVESISFDSDTVSVDCEASIQLAYAIKPLYATNKNVTFTSDSTAIATVSADGLVYGNKVGQAKIRVKTEDGSFEDSCVVNVLYVPFSIVLPDPISASPTTATIPFKLNGDRSLVIGCGIDYSVNADMSDSVNVSAEYVQGQTDYTIELDSLAPSTTYYYRAYVILNDSTADSTIVSSITTKNPDPFPVAGKVDLGLPSGKLWSSFNMGADEEADYGRLMSWGEINGTSISSTAYSQLNVPDFISGNADYDFAAKRWGDKWHTPNMTEWEELFLNTDHSFVTMTASDSTTSVSGWKFTAKDGSGNYIFLPYSGQSNDGNITDNGTIGYYWTGQKKSWDDSDVPTYVTLSAITYGYGYANGYLGYSVRPVYGDVADDFNPYGEDDADKSGETAEATRSVDLGVGPRWAICNVGALNSKSYAFGDYFAWGEVNAKETYPQDGYKGFDASKRSENQGYLDFGANIAGNSEYDAATYHWGGKWRMPTHSELIFIIKRCTWIWTSLNGVYGYRIYGYQDCASNSIFLPAAGRCYDDMSEEENYHGYYWSDTEYTMSGKYGYIAYAYYLSFTSSSFNPADYYRYYGMPIRPVKTK